VSGVGGELGLKVACSDDEEEKDKESGWQEVRRG